MSKFDDLQHEVFTAIESVVFGDEDPSQCEVHSASPLDPRAKTSGWFVIDGCLVVEAAGVKAIEYYGGFEYIDDDNMFFVGSYKVYNGEHPRVQPIIEAYQDAN